MVSVNIAALVLRLVVGGTMMAHGWNHAFGGGKLPGTARWFESIGVRPGRAAAGHLLAPAPGGGERRRPVPAVRGVADACLVNQKINYPERTVAAPGDSASS